MIKTIVKHKNEIFNTENLGAASVVVNIRSVFAEKLYICLRGGYNVEWNPRFYVLQ